MLDRTSADFPRARRCVGLAAVAFLLGVRASAQCSQWEPAFRAPGIDGQVLRATEADLGGGPQLYAAASVVLNSNTRALRVLHSNGAAMTELPQVPLLGGKVPMLEFDDGTGRALYVGGFAYPTSSGGPNAGRVASWDGTAWRVLGPGFNGVTQSDVRALCVFDDGSGARLVAGGAFLNAAGPVVNHVAVWNGSAWNALGAGVDGTVTELVAFDDGSGPALYASGSFTHAGGVLADGVARWNGSAWSAVGTPTSGAKGAMAVLDVGSGRGLYVASTIAPSPVAPTALMRWDGSNWSPAANGLVGVPDVLHSHDDGTGPSLYAGGEYQPSSGAGFVARWNGSTWTNIATTQPSASNPAIHTLTSTGVGSQHRLVAGGDFNDLDGIGVASLAAYDGVRWSAIQSTDGLGWTHSFPQTSGVQALLEHDDGHGRALFACGEFTAAGNVLANGIARWDGVSWSTLGAGIDGAGLALCAFDDGSGPALYCGGDFLSIGGVPFHHIARWDGTSWSPLAAGLDSSVQSLVVHDDGSGPALYAAGFFTHSGALLARSVARWNGTSWQAVGGGFTGGALSLAVHDSGSGPELFASRTANAVMRWDGTTWSALPYIGPVYSMISFDDGTGPALYTGLGNRPFVARWNGSSWVALGGLDGTGQSAVHAFLVHDDGSGPALFAAGSFFVQSTGQLTQRAARWDGHAWSPLETGPGAPLDYFDAAMALATFDAPSGRSLYVGGNFHTVSGMPTSGMARWSFCYQPWRSFCAGDGSASACPCANIGATGHGCSNSIHATGARLALAGTPSIANDTSVLQLESATNQAVFFLQATARDNGGLGTPAFDGLRCINGTITRLATHTAIGGVARYPDVAELPLAVRGAVTAAGARLHYQALYRDPNAAFCPPATANWSNAISVTWQP